MFLVKESDKTAKLRLLYVSRVREGWELADGW